MKSAICNHRNFAWATLCSLCVHLVLGFFLAKPQPQKFSTPMHAEVFWLIPTPEIPFSTAQTAKLKPKRAKRASHHLDKTYSQGLATDAGASQDAGSDIGALGDAQGQDRKILRVVPLLTNGDLLQVPYPPRARHQRIEGTVRMRLTVAKNGEVIKAEIISGPAQDLKLAALRIARKMLFLPATDEQGQARVAEIEHEVIFRLNRAS